MKGIVFFDGKFLPIEKAAVPATDLAFQRGIGLFETLRTYNRVPFLLKERLGRLLKSAKNIGIASPRPGAGLAMTYVTKKVLTGIKRLGASEAVVKIILTAGDGHGFMPENKSRLIVIFSSFVPWPKEYYQRGIKVLSVGLSRSVPTLKSLSYIEGAVAHKQATAKGFTEAVYQDEKGNFLEGTNFNFAVIKRGQIITAKDRILNGLTMSEVLKLAKKLGLLVARRAVSRKDLRGADEAIITSATREVIPVVKVDTMKVGNGDVGKWSKVLLKNYRENAQKQKKK